MSNLRHWLWLSTRGPAPGMYAARVLEHFGTPEGAYYADSAAYGQIPGIPGTVRQALEDKDLTPAETILAKCKEQGIWILTMQDAAYPQRLRQLESAPCVLYGKGTLPQLDHLPVVAIVGARKASPYGVMAARQFGLALARQGILVVSGSAYGVDAAALNGALRGGGEVVSVLGNGIDVTYPAGHEDLYADVARWVKEGWIDYNIPQIYWEIGHPAADYITLIQWWNKNATREGTHLYIGQNVARTMKADQLTRKMLYERSLSKVKGNCFWPANEILWNNKGVADSLKQNYHRYPALIPAYTHLHNRAPQEVKKLKAEWTAQGYMLHWQAEQSKTNPELASYFVIYRFENKESVNLDDPSKIVAVTRETNYLLPYDDGKRKYRYVVTAVDRFHNENQGKSKKVKL